MKKTVGILAATMVLVLGTVVLIAQNAGQGAQAGRGGAQAPAQPMSFFVTSVGKGDGANYGGLTGADAYCQSLAATAGRGGATAQAAAQGCGPLETRLVPDASRPPTALRPERTCRPGVACP